MRAPSRILACWIALMLWSVPAGAQYMRLTTDNPADNTRLRLGVTNIVAITLDTNHDRNGAVQTCNSHSSLSCGAPASPNALDMFSYTIALEAVGGTVSFGTFTAADASYTDISPQIQSSTEVEINKARPTGTFTAPGLATLGTIPVTVVSGSPTVQVQIGASAINPFGFGTGFGTDCDAFGFANTYVVGDLADPCGTTTGTPGDWFDWDGVTANPGGTTQPNIVAPATASATEGTAMSPINATATDADASNTLTITQTGMPADLTFTANSPGPSPRTASISGTPGFSDAGPHNIVWTVDDGTGASNATNTATTGLAIANTNRAPMLNPVSNMAVHPGCGPSTVDQAISASDPDGDALTFSKVAGPTFMTVTTTSPTTGNIRLTPGASESLGTGNAIVRASDGALNNDRTFNIIVSQGFFSPTLAQPANMTVSEGATADQTLQATDACGVPLTFSKVSGPTFVTVTTTSQGSSGVPAIGNLHLAPGAADVGTYSATISASNGSLNNQKSLMITVMANRPPVLNPIANMSRCGVYPDQTVTGSDPDGDALTFSKAAGPTFMTVTTTSPTTGNIHLAPALVHDHDHSVELSSDPGSHPEPVPGGELDPGPGNHGP